ncbi:tetratricopeptide repeat protein [Streptomyces sp. NPDC002265]|uniref:tetratricopeptide repeat protein n=1 Tax=Streptomyces sp. NPDC002265 TaxID=3154415 RepID=UPI003328683E
MTPSISEAVEPAGVPQQVLSGMGGVGKTQLAADYVRTAWKTGDLDLLVWVAASDAEAVVAAYARAGVEVLGAEAADPEAAARAFVAWLEPKSGQRPCRWVIVLDDVVDPGDLTGWWPPLSPSGRTLVTTRRQDALLTGPDRRLVKIGLFTEAESVTYLTTALSARGRREPDVQLAALADDLGRLPLALSQAAAYLVDVDISCEVYRTLLADRTSSLADAAPDTLPDDQRHTMAAAWALSIEHADSVRPAGLARPLLQLASFLAPNGIPEPLLTSPPALAHLSVSASPATGREPVPVTREQARLALRTLHRLSLVDHRPDTPHHAVHVHRLVQRAVRETLVSDHETLVSDRCARTAADALRAIWPETENDAAQAQALRANATAVARCAEDALYEPDAHAVLYRIGRSLGAAGQVGAACEHFRRLCDSTSARLGADHPDTLLARYELAEWQGSAGDVAGAVAGFTELLPDVVRLLGEDHSETLGTRHQLARWRGEAGDAAGAAAEMADLLPHVVRTLGEDHRNTLATRHELASWRGEAGDPAGAAAAMADLLLDSERVLGPAHSDTLGVRHSLATWQGRAGDAAGAAAALADLLPHVRHLYGEDHPGTFATRHQLALFRGRSGDAAGAAADFADLLPHVVRVLGEDHPDVLGTRRNLARWTGEAGDARGAAAAMTDLLPDLVRVLGEDHPDTLTSRYNLASLLGDTGDAVGAAAAFADLLPDMMRVFGLNHPHTWATHQHLYRRHHQARSVIADQ